MNMIQKTSRQPTMNYDEFLILNQGGRGGTPKVDQTFFKQIVYKGGRDTPLADKTYKTVFDRLPIVIISRFWFQESITIPKVWSKQLNGGFTRFYQKWDQYGLAASISTTKQIQNNLHWSISFLLVWLFLWDQSCQQGFEGPVYCFNNFCTSFHCGLISFESLHSVRFLFALQILQGFEWLISFHEHKGL